MIDLPKRLRINFDGQDIGADFEPWVSLPDALIQLAKDVEAIAKFDEEMDDEEMDDDI